MKKYQFMMNFSLPEATLAPDQYLDALFENGCDDASVGIGRLGLIGLDFTRDAIDAESALRSAVRDVDRAIPGSILIQVGPDLVSLTEMATIFGFTRQNMRKYATGSSTREAFPAPVIINEPSLWHFAEIAAWFQMNTDIVAPDATVEISRAAAQMNLGAEQVRIKRMLEAA